MAVATHATTWQQRAVKRMHAEHPTAKAFHAASGDAGVAWDRASALLDGRDGVEAADDEDWDRYLPFLDNNRHGIQEVTQEEDEARRPRPRRPAEVPAEVAALVELDHPHVVKLFERGGRAAGYAVERPRRGRGRELDMPSSARGAAAAAR